MGRVAKVALRRALRPRCQLVTLQAAAVRRDVVDVFRCLAWIWQALVGQWCQVARKAIERLNGRCVPQQALRGAVRARLDDGAVDNTVQVRGHRVIDVLRSRAWVWQADVNSRGQVSELTLDGVIRVVSWIVRAVSVITIIIIIIRVIRLVRIVRLVRVVRVVVVVGIVRVVVRVIVGIVRAFS